MITLYFKSFTRQVKYLSGIFGDNNQRITWDKTRRLVDALIKKECLANYTWLGKTNVKQAKKSAFRSLTRHQVIVAALQNSNDKYTNDDFKEDMVKHVLKYAYLKAENSSTSGPESDISKSVAKN